MVLPYINMNQPQVYTYSPSWIPLPPPPCTIPLGRLSAPAPSIHYHALNLDWWFVSHMILYMFQCFWTVVLEKTLVSPLDCKEIKPVNPKGNQSWIFIGRTEAEVQAPILWPPDAKNWLIGKDPDAGKDWKQEDKGMTEDKLVEWHHWLDGHEFWASSKCWW